MICVSTIDATPMDSADTLRSTLCAKCFNGFQSYQFGWYGQRTKLFDPMVEGKRLSYHAAFVDLQKTNPFEPVLLLLDNTYFIQFNRAKCLISVPNRENMR